jgi:hypothetical protein
MITRYLSFSECFNFIAKGVKMFVAAVQYNPVVSVNDVYSPLQSLIVGD